MKWSALQLRQHKQNSQRGVALVIALMITTIAISLASVAMYRQQIQIRLTGNIASLEQAYQYAIGMEDWSKKILEQDYKDNPKVDTKQEDWATKLPPIPVDGGTLIGRLWDLQGKLNLNTVDMVYPEIPVPRNNNANQPNQPNLPTPEIIRTEPLVYKSITKLFAKLDKDQALGPPENFTDTLWDWIDAKDEERQGGAESGYYQSLEKPYMTANSPLIDISELLLLKGMSKELLEDLKPLVSTLPKETRINLNTAEPEVLEAIGFNAEMTEVINKASEENPFESMNDFWSLPEVARLFAQGSEMGNKKANYAQILTVTSDYFLLEGAVKINNTRIFINSILERKNGKVRVISRDFGNPYKSQPKTENDKSSEPN